MRLLLLLSSIVFGSVISPLWAAEPLAVGTRLPSLTLSDQHDVAATVGVDTKLVIFVRDMDAANVVEDVLTPNGDAQLAAVGAVFISDISRMPRVITNLFALPAMRRRPYRMLLDRDGDLTAVIPSQKGKVTVLRLDQLMIGAIEYFDSADSLRKLLAPPVADKAADKPQAIGDQR